jgi:hypothetical protein
MKKIKVKREFKKLGTDEETLKLIDKLVNEFGEIEDDDGNVIGKFSLEDED